MPTDADGRTDYRDFDGSDQRWEGERFEGCDFTGAYLDGLVTVGCAFMDCDFTQADLSNSRHETTQFIAARFVETRLNESTFIGCKMSGAVFDRVGARGITLEGGDFTGRVQKRSIARFGA